MSLICLAAVYPLVLADSRDGQGLSTPSIVSAWKSFRRSRFQPVLVVHRFAAPARQTVVPWGRCRHLPLWFEEEIAGETQSAGTQTDLQRMQK
jgi:hypothetical protein